MMWMPERKESRLKEDISVRAIILEENNFDNFEENIS